VETEHQQKITSGQVDEQKAQIEREKLRVGLLEFEDDFQEEWHHVAKQYKLLKERKTHVDFILNSRLSEEFTLDFKNGNLPEVVCQEVNENLDISQLIEEFNENFKTIVKHSKKSLHDIKLADSANSLANVIAALVNRKAYYNGSLPDNGGCIMTFAVPLLILAFLAVIGMLTGIISDEVIIFGIYLCVPGPVLLYLAIKKITKHKAAIEKQRRLDNAFNRTASLLSPKFRSAIWADSKAVVNHDFRSLDSILRGAFFNIKEAHRASYYNAMITQGSPSSAGREIYSSISDLDKVSGIDDFFNLFREYEAQYSYMREAIIEVGEDILNGHRVPCRMKKKRIALMKCPSCGGPLAKDSSSQCPYCGSTFRMY